MHRRISMTQTPYESPPPPKLVILFNSEPSGAIVYQDGQSMGQCPLQLTYDPDLARQNGKVKGLTACWPDGQRVSVPEFVVDMERFGLSQQYTFFIPSPLKIVYNSTPPSQNPNQQGTDPQAEAEYQQALQEYNTAVDELQKLRVANSAYTGIPAVNRAGAVNQGVGYVRYRCRNSRRREAS